MNQNGANRFSMYKKTARANHRKMMKSNGYAPSLATLSEKHDKSQWGETINRGVLSKKKARKKRGNTIFGMRFR